MSPPLVVAFALAGPRRHRSDATSRSARARTARRLSARHLADAGRGPRRDAERARRPRTFRELYANFAEQNPKWNEIPIDARACVRVGSRIDLHPGAAVLRRASAMKPGKIDRDQRRAAARHLRRLRDDRSHLPRRRDQERPRRPASTCIENGVAVEDFNSYGSRRGNDRVMTRGTFANVRIKNLMVPGAEGGVTIHQPDGERMSIYDAAMKYQDEGTPLVVFAGQEYGTGSSRDWAAKGTRLLGVKAVVAQSFERIHRSQPRRHGRAAAAVQGRHERADAEARRHRDVRHHRPRAASCKPRQDVTLVIHRAGRRDRRSAGHAAHRYADRDRLLPARRHPAVRAAATHHVAGRRPRG